MLIQEIWHILTKREPVVNPTTGKKKSLKRIIHSTHSLILGESFILQRPYSEYAIFNSLNIF